MDTDLMTLWLHAEYLSKDEARDLITELQAACDEDRVWLAAIKKAFDAMYESTVDKLDYKLGKLGDVIEGTYL